METDKLKHPGINCYRQATFDLLNDEPFEDYLHAVVFAICQGQGKYLIIGPEFQKMLVVNESALRYIPPFVETKKPSKTTLFTMTAETQH